MAAALHRAELPFGSLAAIVLPVGGSLKFAPLWQHQGDRAMVPASTMKLVTSMVALDRLGPNLRGHTELWTAAPLLPGNDAGADGGILQGDLILRGGADVQLGLPQLWALMAELRFQGIREIAGDIVLDRQLFRPARPDIGLPPFDEAPEFAYNMVPDALQLAGNLMGLEIRSDGQRVQARALPPLPGLVVDASAMTLNDRPCHQWGKDWVGPPLVQDDGQGTLTVLLRGAYPRHCEQRPQLSLIDRNALAERHLRWVWQSLGGVWAGRVREAQQALLPAAAPLPAPLARLQPPRLLAAAIGTQAADVAATTPAESPATASASTVGTTTGPRRLARHEAAPWGELLRTLNKQSDNAYTRVLYLLLGVNAMAQQPDKSTAQLADLAVRQWLAEQRIAAPGLVLDNGSGLSRSERITPRTLALALRAAHASRWGAELVMSLPLAGVDGSMRNRLGDSPAGGWARLKTGTLRDSTALAGYVPDDRGRWWVVTAMVNHERASAGRPALDALVDWVARGGMAQSGRLMPGWPGADSP